MGDAFKTVANHIAIRTRLTSDRGIVTRLIHTDSSGSGYTPLVEEPRRPPKHVGRRPSTPAEPDSSHDQPRVLPEDLLRDASRRLGIISLLAAALWTIATLFGKLAYHALNPGDTTWLRPHIPDAIAATSVVVSFALFLYTKRTSRSPSFVLDLGLIYQIYTALALGLTAHSYTIPGGVADTPEISWIGAVILISAAIVPNDPRKILGAGLISASMNPLGMLIFNARLGSHFAADVHSAFLMHYPDYLLIGAAVVISNVVMKLGHQVTKARELGSYELGDLLGKGGMGEVYKATHRMLARPAAIKLMRVAAIGDAQSEEAKLAVARFRREAEAAASLRSPHTVELYDFGVTDDGTLYFVMELLDGLDLESLVRTHGPLPANRAIFILQQVCDSLAEAHTLGLVHRDIKPANIHVGRVGLHYDFVKVLDFGLVKRIASRDDDGHLATAAGLTPGTPSYMAPEVMLDEPYDGRADLYALGCVSYFLLTGLLVFDGFDAMNVMAKHLRVQPTAPSRRATQYLPAGLDGVVLACLAKRPEERPRDAGELARLLASIDVQPWTEEQAQTWWEGRAR